MQLFGLDFMIDENFKSWLIEINTNPCLECSGSLLSRIIPSLVENVFRIAIDPLFPPPNWSRHKKNQIPDNPLEGNKFELFFDELSEGEIFEPLLKNKKCTFNKNINIEYIINRNRNMFNYMNNLILLIIYFFSLFFLTIIKLFYKLK